MMASIPYLERAEPSAKTMPPSGGRFFFAKSEKLKANARCWGEEI